MTNDFYGFYKDESGYVVTKNGDDFLHTTTQISAADIVERLMADAVTVCDVNKFEDCQRYGKDCDGRGE